MNLYVRSWCQNKRHDALYLFRSLNMQINPYIGQEVKGHVTVPELKVWPLVLSKPGLVGKTTYICQNGLWFICKYARKDFRKVFVEIS